MAYVALPAAQPSPTSMHRSDRTRFVIAGMARSGTTITHQAVQGHPNVQSTMDEVKVIPFFSQGISVFTVGGVNDYERDHGFARLFDAITMMPCTPNARDDAGLLGYAGTTAHPKGAVRANGIKVALYHPDEMTAYVGALRKHPSLAEVATIWVDRTDLVAQFGSWHRAMRSGKWHSFAGSPTAAIATAAAQGGAAAEPPQSFVIPEEEFVFYCQEVQAINQAFQDLATTHRVLRLSYEDEIAKLGAHAYEPVFRFLGLPWITPTWVRSEKVSPPVESFVQNAERLYEILRDLVPATR